MFGNSWMEMEPQQIPCPPVGSSFTSPCAGVDVQALMVRKTHKGKLEQLDFQMLTDRFLSLCREWRRFARCSSTPRFRAVTTLWARCRTWPAAPTTSASKNVRVNFEGHGVGWQGAGWGLNPPSFPPWCRGTAVDLYLEDLRFSSHIFFCDGRF